MKRLDVEPLGKPSEVRLSKLLSRGFHGFQSQLPEGSIPELYNDGNPIGCAWPPPSSPSGVSASIEALGTKRQQKSSTSSQQQNPFGGGNNSGVPNPFTNSNNGSGMSSPFGVSNTNKANNTTATSSNPFGVTSNSNGEAGNAGFGSGQQSNQSQGGFFPGSQPQQPPPNPFAPQTSQANDMATDESNNINRNNFMDTNNASSASPFTTSNTSATANPFGFPAKQSVQTPFGGGSQQPSTTSSSPFNAFSSSGQSAGVEGTPSASPFGNRWQAPQAQNNIGSGGSSNNKDQSKKPCRFFSQGKCRYGNDCKFSHDSSANDSGGGGFGQSSSSVPNQSPFASGGFGQPSNGTNPSPFGGGGGSGGGG
eukprot:CAMPEP_0171294056 /NCGR_PEP_ID=MMETSP0816-20121228/2431_1 /TAXON_ID=420281 /ORGANISM="Proboscia inermis, Strain CCAP1064/1" /LENGTH=365 /DNA_ID=CAMNT_0011765491 /DNA_START=66 /DNA_END=1160 /DNA_ORIENTATION=-